jgi:hypothetical protein
MPSKITRIFFLIFTIITFNISAKDPNILDLSQIAPEGLSRAQAKQVLIFIIKHQTKIKFGKSGVFIDGDLSDQNGNPSNSGYFDFALGYDDPEAAATEYMGSFSVSILTGDVWETNRCERYTFPALQRIQKTIMKQTGKTLADEKVQRRGLGCTDE